MDFSSFFSFGSFNADFEPIAIPLSYIADNTQEGKVLLSEEDECVNFVYKQTPIEHQRQITTRESELTEEIEIPVMDSETTIKFQHSRLGKIHKEHEVAWLPTEDDLLVELYQMYGNKQWKMIADELNRSYGNARTPTQCNQHYNRVIRAGLLKGRWTDEQDQRLREAIERCGPTKWREIAKFVGNRTDTQVRYRAMKQYPEYYE